MLNNNNKILIFISIVSIIILAIFIKLFTDKRKKENYSQANTNARGNFISKWGTNGSGTSEFSGKNLSCAFYPGKNLIIVSDVANNRIQIFDSSGNFVRMFGSKGNYDCQFNSPNQVAVCPSRDEIYIADSGNNRIQVFNSNGKFLRNFGSLGRGPGQMLIPTGVALSANESEVIVIESVGFRGQVFTPEGTYKRTFGKYDDPGSLEGQFMVPWSVATAGNGDVVIMDTGNNKVLIYDSQYNFKSEFKLPDFPVDCKLTDWVTKGPVIYNKKSQKRSIITPAVGGGRQCGPLEQVVQVKHCKLENQKVCTPYENQGARGGFITLVPTVKELPENGGTPCPNPMPAPYPAPVKLGCSVDGKCPWGFVRENDGITCTNPSGYLPSTDPNKGETYSDMINRSLARTRSPSDVPAPDSYIGIFGEKNLPKRLLARQKEHVTFDTCKDLAAASSATVFALGYNTYLDNNLGDYSHDKVKSTCYFNPGDQSIDGMLITKDIIIGTTLFENYSNTVPIGITIQDTKGNVFPRMPNYDVAAFYSL
jgi:hypothetical protein